MVLTPFHSDQATTRDDTTTLRSAKMSDLTRTTVARGWKRDLAARHLFATVACFVEDLTASVRILGNLDGLAGLAALVRLGTVIVAAAAADSDQFQHFVHRRLDAKLAVIIRGTYEIKPGHRLVTRTIYFR